MSPAAQTYTIISRAQINKWDNQLKTGVEGWELAVRWESTGTILNVFVPVTKYTPDQVDALIKAAGAKDEAIDRLGE